MLDGMKTLETLKQMVDNPQQNYWNRLKDSTDKMDTAQVSWVMSQDSVKKVYEDMMESFNSFLFEKFKEDFSAVPAFQPTIEKYVNTILESSQEYGKRTKELEEENKRLKQQLEEALNANGHTAE